MRTMRHMFNGWARRALVCGLVGTVAISSPAHAAPLAGLERLEHLPPDNPLVGQWIRVIYQDSHGFLWLGGINGVHRFDGYSVKSFHHDPSDPRSLPSNFINSLFEDSQGVLWIATMGGLARLDGHAADESGSGQFVTTRAAGLFTTFRHDSEDSSSLSDNSVSGIAEDRFGALWVSTYAGVNRFDRGRQSFTRFAIDPADLSSTRTLTIHRGQAGDLWFGSEGLLRFNHQTESLERHPLPATSQSSDGIWRIAEDDDGFLWSGTEEGHLYRFDPRIGEARLFNLGKDSRGYITALMAQPDDRLWIGTDKQGLLVLDTTTGEYQAYSPRPDTPGSLSAVQVSAILRDHTGVVWLGTAAGLDKYVPSKERFALHRHRADDPMSLSSNTINALTGDPEGGYWIGTDTGLERMDDAGRVTRRYRHNPDDPDSLLSDTVRALVKSGSGELWVATGQGLDRLDAERGAFVHLRPDQTDPQGLIETIHHLAETEPGTLWIGGVGGINRLDTATRRLKRYTEPGIVISMLADAGGELWLATYGRGLMHFDPSKEIFTTHSSDRDVPQSLSSDRVIALHRDSAGVLWIGTLGGGLNRFDPIREEFTRFRERDGLVNDNVVGILEDPAGGLWLSTTRGLSRFEPATDTWSSYTAEDGLQGSVFNPNAGWRSSTGELFFGGPAGLTSFFPDLIVIDPRPPEVAITDFLLVNRSTPFAARHSDDDTGDVPHLILDHRDDIFAFEFAALHFDRPEKNHYAYRLAGFNGDWIETTGRNRLAQYTNLDSGDYVFQVKAANSDGVWNHEGTSVRITVLPPPWKTWWAYALYTLTLLAIVLSYVRSHRHELQRQQEAAETERQSAERERAISRKLRAMDQLKDDFLAKTSHELRTPLYGITGLAESLIDGATGELPEASRANLSMIVASGRRLSHLVNDILDFSNLRHKSLELDRRPVDLKPLTEVVLTLSRPLVGTKQLELRNSVPADLPAADADENRLQQILYNLVGNAIKFTAKGSVEVSAALADGLLEMRVADTGIGIPKAEHERIFDAFEQVDASMEREYGGTGLGLAVTRQLVELHGGSINVESADDEGATFIFDLPVAESPAKASTDRPDMTPVPLPAAIEDTQELLPIAEPNRIASDALTCILVVDDEPINRQVLTNHLGAAGYHIVQAASGPEALARIEKQLPDLILLDIMMPRMSGYEVCRTLRSRFSLNELPVLFLTAKSQPSDLVMGLAVGANDYLPKPISKTELLARVTTHLALRTVNHQLSELVSERTVEVEERGQLLQERQRLITELESRNAELARFNYTISHDLKNPLTTIKNFLGLARRDAAEGEFDRLEDDLDRVQAAADKLTLLLEELFEFSRVGLQTNPSEDVALGDLVRQARLALSDSIAERGAVVEVAPDLPSVHGDRQRLEEITRHLIDNALRYAREGIAPRIEIGSRRQCDEAADYEPIFYIRDNGIGIDPQYHEKVFGLFERLDPAATPGTGIGLALVKRVIDVHGGRIWVESEGLGRGSTFCLTLPSPGEQSQDSLPSRL